MIRRRSALIDVLKPRHSEFRPPICWTPGGGTTAITHRTSFLSLPMFIPPSFFLLLPSSSSALALSFLRSGLSLPIRGGAHHGSAASLHTQL